MDLRFLVKGNQVLTPSLAVGPATLVSGARNKLYLLASGFENTDCLCANPGSDA